MLLQVTDNFKSNDSFCARVRPVVTASPSLFVNENESSLHNAVASSEVALEPEATLHVNLPKVTESNLAVLLPKFLTLNS